MRILLSIAFIFSFVVGALAQLTINVESIPANTPDGTSIHIAGNFNGWDPGDPDFILNDDGDGTYSIVLNIDPGTILFKFTRGSWETVEGNANGQFLPDRSYTYNGGEDNVELTILTWEDVNTGGNSTAAENVSILDENFYMPQLDRNRKIWLYLPPDYDGSAKEYPVLYMHDGQNLFDDQTSFVGEWHVDESLNTLFDQGDYGIIVVGIDNGGGQRLDEYSPWVNPQYGGGDGDAYIDFIKNTLKPHIDQNFRTLTGPEYTGIMGSSMGGLISMYGSVEHQEVFGKSGCFSSAFWFSGEAYNHVETTGKEQDVKFYMIAGDLEDSGSVVNAMNAMEQSLLTAGFSNEEIMAISHADGQHSEWYWDREFPAAYQWLFGEIPTAVKPAVGGLSILVYPNPASDTLFIKTDNQNDSSPSLFKLVDINGRTLMKKKLRKDLSIIKLKKLSSGFYFAQIWNADRLVKVEKIFIN